MPAPDIILDKPFLLVSLSASPLGIVPLKQGFVIGYVEKVYETSDKTETGQYVMFDKDKSRAFVYGSTVYYIVDENDSLFQENPAL
jgi:hypothetical protein